MEKKVRTITITVHDREKSFQKVSEQLHSLASNIQLRVGYPFPNMNVSVIFVIIELTNDELGAFSGKLGQIDSVQVKSTTLKI
ncbi:MAG: iron-only hydrogenase system regulator [Candidatus Cloacimonetes bacterium 4572_65]|nr:MAG: iron-only hydrogenase system regulator [Candidatus Cloacimonetes bacterium 4572_65]